MESKILARLCDYHTAMGDLFYTGVKNGATYNKRVGQLKIIDGLAVKPSWANQMVTGYEVKSTRGDFRQDEKWHSYISNKMCNKIYIAAVPGIVKKGELPDGVGLVEIGDKSIKWTKRASILNVEIDPKIWQYIVYSRMPSDECPFHSKINKIAHFEEWVKAHEEGKRVANLVSHMLDYKINSAVKMTSHDEERQNRANAFMDLCRCAGINYCYNVEKDCERVKEIIKDGRTIDAFTLHSKGLERNLEVMLNIIRRLGKDE